MRRIYVIAPFLEALKEALAYLRFWRELLSGKGELVAITKVLVEEVSCAVLQNKTLSKLHDPGSFFISCSIGDLHIERALCDLV